MEQTYLTFLGGLTKSKYWSLLRWQQRVEEGKAHLSCLCGFASLKQSLSWHGGAGLNVGQMMSHWLMRGARP